MASSWNSVGLEVLYQVLGWVAFFAWSFSFYPQVILNYKRKSVVGLNFDFLVLNLTKHSSYLIYKAALFFSPFIQRQYHEKYGEKEMIPVAANDVAFSLHAVTLTAITVFQVFIYERGTQKVSKVCISISAIVWTAAIVCLIVAWPKSDWLWLIDVFNSIQVGMTAIKYIPQAIMNFTDRLFRHGLSTTNLCSLCCQEVETLDHILLHCVFSREVWFKVLRWLPGLIGGSKLAGSPHRDLQRQVDSLILLVSWMLWKERNARFHNNHMSTPEALVTRIKEEAEAWATAGFPTCLRCSGERVGRVWVVARDRV